MCAHVGEDVEVAIAKRMMEQHTTALRDGGRAADNVNDGDHLGEGAGQAIDSRELTNTKCGDEGRDLVDSGISIGGVSCKVGRVSW